MGLGDFLHKAVNVVTAPVKAVVNTVEDGAHAVVNTVENGVNAAAHAGSSIVSSALHGVGQVFSPVTHSIGVAFGTASHLAGSAMHGASGLADWTGGAVKSAVNFGVHAADQTAHSVVNAGHDVLNLGIHEISTVGKTIGNAAVDVGTTMAKDASHVFTTVTNGVGTIGSEAAHGIGGITHAIGDGVSAIGTGVLHTAGDVLNTGVKVGGDIVHTAGSVLGDIAHGDIGQAGKDVVAGVGKTGSDVVHGAGAVAHDVGQATAGVGHAVVEAGSAAASGVLEMAGTAAGVAGSFAKDYEHAMGVLVKDAVDIVGQIAKSEVAFGYGTAGIAAHTVGTPVGDFYANVAKHYGDAAIATLDHVNQAIDDAVIKGTTAGGDIVNSVGHGADILTHDSSKVIGDISRGDFSAALHDAGQFGNDALQVGKDFAGAEVEGAKALAAIATGIGTVLGGLNEAMARAGGGFVSAVGETVGGKVGHGLDDAGDWLGDKTAMTADLVQGNVSGAAVEGAKVLGGMAGQWLGDHVVKDLASSLGDRVGGVVGDGIKALGDAGADAVKDGLKELAGTAAGKGIDVVKGGDDHAPKSDDHGDTANASAKPDHDPSLMEKIQHGIDDFAHQKIDQAGDLIQKATHDPQWLFNQIADAVKDHYGKSTTDALGKLFGTHDSAHDSSHASGDAAHASDGMSIGSTHAALTADASGSSLSGDHLVGHSQASSAITHALHEGTLVSAVENAHLPVLQAHPLVPSIGDHASESAPHASLAAQGGNETGASAGHDMQAALQNALHIFSDAHPQFSNLALDVAHALQGHGADGGNFTIGGHEVSMESLAHVSLPQVADFFDHMPAHIELPSMLESHFAHHHM